jgi:predicted RecB family nuclease
MADPKDPTEEIQAQVLDGIRKSQEAVIDGMRAWTETVQQLVPGGAQAVPGASQLPSPAEVVDSVFDFAAQLLGASTAIGERVQEETKKAADTAAKATGTSRKR